jgi:outer membrane receptor protein involved in Fe transport
MSAPSKFNPALRPLALALLSAFSGASQSQTSSEPSSASTAATSASPGPAAPADASNPLNLESVVVTGASERTVKMRAPYAISTIDAQAIRQKAPRSSVDLLRALPGVTVENSGGEGGGENVVIRGLPFSGFRLLDMQEDGLPLFESNFERQLQIDELFRVDLNTQRVELVRGGTAPIFSNNASGGVVNFITNHGTATPERSVRLSTGTGDLRRADLQMSGPVDDRLPYSLSGFYRQSDGLRDTGFKAGNRGGQLKAGMSYDFDNGSVFADVKLLDDHGVFYSAIPLLDPRNGNSLDVLIDPHRGTLTSNNFRTVSFPAGDGAGGTQTVSRDLRDGAHPNVKTLTAGGDFALGDGWSLSDKARYARGSVGFDAIFNGSPSDAQTNLNNALAGAKSAFPTAASLRYVLAGSSTPYDPAASAGLIMTNTWSSTRTDYTFAVNDLRVNKAIDSAAWGKHKLSFGVQASRSTLSQQQLGNALLTNVSAQPSALDIQALDASGAVVGNLTQNGFSTYGSGDLVGNVKAVALAAYAAESWSITPDWQVDVGVRHETRKEDGNRGVIGSITAATSGPVAARKINGLTGFVPYSKTQGGTAWTLGTSEQFSTTTNGFARYSSAYSLPRFSDQWVNINNGVAGTLPDGQPVPVTPIKQAELGLKYAVPTLQLSVIGFWSNFKNLNSSTYVSNAAGILSNQPLLINTTTKGVELEATWQPVRPFELSGSVTLQSPKIDSGNTFDVNYTAGLSGRDIPRTPRYNASLSPAYRFNTDSGSGRVYATVYTVGKRYQDFVNTSVLPAYTTLDLGLSGRLSQALSFDLAVTNVTNSAGLTEGNARAPVGNSFVASDATVGRPIFGRGFVASMTAQW